MRAWKTPQLARYLADKARDAGDSPCDDRPSPDHAWLDGVGWVVPADLADRRAAAAVDAHDRLLFEVNFNQENRLRVLEGKAQVTRAQYRDALVAEFKRINAS